MQSYSYRRTLSLTLMLCIGATPIMSLAEKIEPKKPTITLSKVIGTTILATAILSYIRLVTKKTQPKRVHPKDDSLKEQIRYIVDELWIGQAEKGERPDKLVINEENPNELLYKYSKVEARGVCGILYSTLKPVIIPALTLMILLNKNSEDVYCSIQSMFEFIEDPIKYLADLKTTCSNKRKQEREKFLPKPSTN